MSGYCPTTSAQIPEEKMSIKLFRKVLLRWLDKCPAFNVGMGHIGDINVRDSICGRTLASIELKEDAAYVRIGGLWSRDIRIIPYSDPNLEIRVKRAVNDAYTKSSESFS